MQVFFDHRVQLAPRIWESYFRPAQKVDYQAGQYVSLRLAGLEADRRGPSRTFTLTSVPSDELISFVSKHSEPGSLYKRQLLELSPEDTAEIGDAMGDLVLPKSGAIPLIFIAGGIGMASYAAMLKTIIATQERREVFLFYAVRHKEELIFENLTEQYSLTCNVIMVSPNRLTVREIQPYITEAAQVYLSGSQLFVEALRHDLQQLGLGHEQIVFDYFDGYTEL